MGTFLELRKKADGTLQITGDPPKNHSLSDRFVMDGLASGLVSMDSGTLILHTDPEELKYKIVRAAGLFDDSNDPDNKWHEAGSRATYHEYVLELED